MDELRKLEVVSKVASELQNHLGISDKTLAEFIIHENSQCDGQLSTFKQKMEAIYPGFPDTLTNSIHRINNPASKPSKSTSALPEKSNVNDMTKKFPGLSIPDAKFGGDVLDDTFAMLETMSKPKTTQPNRKRSISPAPSSRRNNNENYYKRSKRSPSPYRDQRGGGYNNRGRGGRYENDRPSGRRYQNDVNGYQDRHSNRYVHGHGYNKEQQRSPSPYSKRAGQSKHYQEDDYHSRPNNTRNPPRKKRLTTPEKWEVEQLRKAGIKGGSLPDLDGESDDDQQNFDDDEEDLDIEVREDEPPFLQGQTKLSLELSPIRTVKIPDGSLNRAALEAESHAINRKEKRQLDMEKAAAEQETNQIDLIKQWQDPMAAQDSRILASELRSRALNSTNENLPEWKRISQNSKQVKKGKQTNLSIKEQRESLPVFKFRQAFLEAVEANSWLVVVGETGSGKTTQLTQYLAEAGYAEERMIGCTQPRRVAAMSVAKRVAEELGAKLGQEVGYTIRFEDYTTPGTTKIKYMTDGILQREILLDPLLTKYSVIMLDEAHERTIATDVLFGLLKKTMLKRSDLKVIATSATLDSSKFSEYFNKCPVFTIPGRAFPVEIQYAREPESDYVDAALITVLQIHVTEPAGDILLFLTGKEEIDQSCEILSERMKELGPNVPELLILPAYGALPSEVASKIFDPAPSGVRKVVLATNIAETSITIDGIYYVIDPGFSKQSEYNAKLGMDKLTVTPISQAQARQRSGRAGRTGPGKCFRLYTEAAFLSEMQPTATPEIQRQSMSNTILMLKAMGINDIVRFDFMDPPNTNTTWQALKELHELGALDDDGLLTQLGRKMADLPMEPALGKALIASASQGCSDEMLTIVAMLSTLHQQQLFSRPREKQEQADRKKAKFFDSSGDHITMLNVYNAWKREDRHRKISWCQENFLSHKSLERVENARNQLVTIFQRHKLPLTKCNNDSTLIRKAICSGFFRNAARKSPEGNYTTVMESTPVHLHPSSALWGRPAETVVYHSLVETTKEFMNCVSQIDQKWLLEAAPALYQATPRDQLSKRKKAERIQPLHNKFEREGEWRLSSQRKQGRGGAGTWG